MLLCSGVGVKCRSRHALPRPHNSYTLTNTKFGPKIHIGMNQPNILLIMNDDMGYSDIGCYGGEVRTPNLDQLAARGVRFTQFYNTARCCPTRASILTGLHPHQAGIGWMTADLEEDGYRGDLNNKCVTIAEALKVAGYGTYMSGKWHVSRNQAPDGSKHCWPCQRGFDHYFGILGVQLIIGNRVR